MHSADDRMETPSGITDHRGQIFRDNTTPIAGQKHRLAEKDQEECSPARGRHRSKQETVPDAPSVAKGSMDLPVTARRSVSPTCAGGARSRALSSRSSTHKSRARTTSAQRARVIALEKKPRNTSRGSERDRFKVKEGNVERNDARISDENVMLRQQLERATSNNQLLYQQAAVHVGGLIENELAAKNELTRVRSIAERESLRLTAELAKAIAERAEIERTIALSSETHMSLFDAEQLFKGQAAKWAAEEKRLHAEYKLNLAEVKSEAQIYGLQSAGSANTTAHELKQELVHEQQMSLTEMRSEMKLEEASITIIAQQCVAEVVRSETEAREKAIALRTELQAELIVAQFSTASNDQLNFALNQAQHTAHQESQQYRHEAAAAFQYKQAADSLDMQLQARASSPGVDSNPTIPDAANIARDVLPRSRQLRNS